MELAERRAISLYSLGKLDECKVDDEADRIRTEREAWKEELARLEEQLEEICQTIGTRLDELSFEGRRDILEAFGLRVRVKLDRS